MTDQVFVVQEEPTGRWITGCCDDRCRDSYGGMHTVADVETKSRATAAATRHRRYLRTLPTWSEKPRTDECHHCGQSSKAITDLQQLVTELERALATNEAAS